MRLNCENPWFEMKFKRKAKVWTLEMIHELWLKTIERTKIRREQFTSCINEIVNTIEPEVERDEKIYRVYFLRKSQVHYYQITKSQFTDGYGYRRELLNFADRDQKLKFLLSNEKSFELGEKMNNLETLLSYQHSKIKSILSDRLHKYLLDEFVRKGHFNPLNDLKTIIVNIQHKSYFVNAQITTYSNPQYIQFELLHEVRPDTTFEIPTHV